MAKPDEGRVIGRRGVGRGGMKTYPDRLRKKVSQRAIRNTPARLKNCRTFLLLGRNQG